MPKMIETVAMIRSMVAKKCRFRRIREIDTEMAAGDCGATKSFLTMS
jgi:hypothetical protein